MIRRCFSLSLALCIALSVWADKVVLHNGRTIEGQVLVQNEQVVIIRDANGMRFQFPAEDVLHVSVGEAVAADTVAVEASVSSSVKKAAILLEVAGGGSSVPQDAAGGNVSVDVMVGTFDLAARHIFLGGGLGYRGVFLGGKTYSYIPVEVAVRVPFLAGVHAPYAGASLGYGFAAGKDYKGGLSAGLDVGYRYQSSAKSAIAVSLFASFQQTKMEVLVHVREADEITPSDFVDFSGRSLVLYGVKFAVYF